jgi:hypothetical protein
VSHGVLKKGLKKHLNPPFLYRLGGLKNSTTMKQEPIFSKLSVINTLSFFVFHGEVKSLFSGRFFLARALTIL